MSSSLDLARVRLIRRVNSDGYDAIYNETVIGVVRPIPASTHYLSFVLPDGQIMQQKERIPAHWRGWLADGSAVMDNNPLLPAGTERRTKWLSDWEQPWAWGLE